LAFVVELHNSLVKRGGRLILVNANTRVREVLALTHIDRIVPTYAEAGQAENAFRVAVAC
jgi:anti-anti-sigma regulatory factor